MRNKFRLSTLFTALSAALFLNACGGGDDAAVPPAPDPAPEIMPFKFELLAGEVAHRRRYDEKISCQSQDGTVGLQGTARFETLEDIFVTPSGIYLLEGAEDCLNRRYRPGTLIPETHGARIVKITGQDARTVVHLHDYAPLKKPPMLVEHPSSLYVDEEKGEYFVLGRVAAPAKSMDEYAPSNNLLKLYDEQNVWDYFSPGLFRFDGPNAASSTLLAGSMSEDRVMGSRVIFPRSGYGRSATMYAPHSLVHGRNAFFFVDYGNMRIIFPENQMTVEMLVSIPDENVFGVAEGADGEIHYISNDFWRRYGSRNFQVYFGPAAEFLGTINFGRRKAFDMVNDDMVVSTGTTLLRVKSDKTIEYLTGKKEAPDLQTFLDNPREYKMPTFPRAIRYGPDGHLYVLFDRGVLVARDFR